MNKFIDNLSKNIELLSSQDTTNEYKYIPQKIETPLPDVNKLKDAVELFKSIIFPGFFGNSGSNTNTQKYYIGVNLEKLYIILEEQIKNGLYFFKDLLKENIKYKPEAMAQSFINAIPALKSLLCKDVKAVFDGDPAAKSYGEVIFCYPAILSMIHYRMAHVLLELGIPVIPRIITELAHSKTGIDIHPGAKIGEFFSIDHGTGVVIGETCIIGNNVRLYQGVTLGAKSFTLDEKGMPINTLRHPIIEDNVIIYSNSSVLGRVTIGHDSIIGGNVWMTRDVPPFSRIFQQKAISASFTDGLGI